MTTNVAFDYSKSELNSSIDETLNIQSIINKVGKYITPVWPLETFIATNPLKAYEETPFHELVISRKNKHSRYFNDEALNNINREMIKWFGAFLDIGQGTIEIPNKEKGFYLGVLAMLQYDKSLHKNKSDIKSWLKSMPENKDICIMTCLDRLGIDRSEYEAFIKETMLHLPGWAGYIKWKSGNCDNIRTNETSVTLTDMLAVRLMISVIVSPEILKEEKKKIP